jgi:membrane protein involved in colicin uptake
MRTLITTVAIGLAAIAPAAAAEARAPVTRADAWHAAQRVAEQSATGIEDLTNGAASVDRSRTSVGNYRRYGRFGMGASFALFGTDTVDGVAHTLWCVGNLEVVRAKNGRPRVAVTFGCPAS